MKTFRHAAKMVWRNFRSYAMLSVTIVLSFALLLGYLVFTDADLYNRYKDIFARDRNLVSVGYFYETPPRIQMMIEKAEGIGNTHHYTYYRTAYAHDNTLRLKTGERVHSFWIELTMLPRQIWSYENWDGRVEIHWLDGKVHEGVRLEEDEILMDEQLFKALELDKSDDPRFNIKPQQSRWEKKVRVVGTIPSTSRLTFVANSDDDQLVQPEDCAGRIVASQELGYPGMDLEANTRECYGGIVFYTDAPEQVAAVCRSILDGESIGVGTVYEQQDAALIKIRAENRTKATIALGLLIMLGINLYSSFTNALNDRKFEIGVKRAVGASQWAIIRQFLYESMLVLLADIVLAVSLVMDVFILYKFIVEHTPNELGICPDWILYVSPFSMAMFGVCAVSLTVVFSLIFAYKSTQVEIVSYLKAE